MRNVAIFGVPRSGTSWIGQIFNSSPQTAYRYQPIFSYSFKESIDAQSNQQEIKIFYKALFETTDDFVQQNRNISGNKTPSFSKKDITHLVWKEVRYLDIIQNIIENSETKVIGIVRHPCGVINSWRNAPREFEDSWNILEEWRNAEKKNKNCHDFYGFEKWIEATELFLYLEKQFPEQFATQSYEKFAAKPVDHIQKLFDFVSLPFTEQTKSFIKKSTSSSTTDPYDVFRKNKTGFEWINQLDTVIINEIKKDDRFKEIEKHFGWNSLEQKNR
jgi:hypothetical protein